MEQSKKLLPRLVLHLFLITFSLVFLFPFLWMICGSMKLREEMAGEKSRLLPAAPQVVGKTPYFRSGTDSVADVPEDIPEAGEYLDAEPGEWDEYIRTLKDRGCSSKGRGYVILIRYRSCTNRTAPVKWSDSPLSRRKAGGYVACAAK